MAYEIINLLSCSSGPSELRGGTNYNQVATQRRTGNRAYELIDDASDSTIEFRRDHLNDYSDYEVLGFAIRFSDVIPDASYELIQSWEGIYVAWTVRVLQTTGYLELDAGGVTEYTGTSNPFTVNTWHYVEIYVYRNDTTGVHALYIDGVQYWNESNIDTLAATTGNFFYRIQQEAAANVGSIYVDDIYVLGSDTVQNGADERLGPGTRVFEYRGEGREDATLQLMDSATGDHGALGNGPGVPVSGDYVREMWGYGIPAQYQLDSTGSYGSTILQSTATIGLPLCYGMFDGHNSWTDPDGVWTNETFLWAETPADSGMTVNVSSLTISSATGTETTNELRVDGTSITQPSGLTDSDIDKVFVRGLVDDIGTGDIFKYRIYTDGEAESLLLRTAPGGFVFVLADKWQELTVPSGGWTWSKIQNLEAVIWAENDATNGIHNLSVVVCKNLGADADVRGVNAGFDVWRGNGQGSVHHIVCGNDNDGDNVATTADGGTAGDVDEWGTSVEPRWVPGGSAIHNLPTTQYDILAGVGTDGAQDANVSDGRVLVLWVPPANLFENVAGVTASLTGGSVSLQTTMPVSGVIAAVTEGSVTESLSIFKMPSGVTLAVTEGSIALASTLPVTGVTAAVTEGALTLNSTLAVTGVSATVTEGALSLATALSTAGVTAAVTAGALSLQTAVSVAGATATISAGTVTDVISLTKMPSGVTLGVTEGALSLATALSTAGVAVALTAGAVTLDLQAPAVAYVRRRMIGFI